MAIYELFEQPKQEEFTETFERLDENPKKKSSVFSSLVTRFCFLLLLIADFGWLVFNTVLLVLVSAIHLGLGTKKEFTKKWVKRFWLHFIRSVACGLSLFIGLFTPPFGGGR